MTVLVRDVALPFDADPESARTVIEARLGVELTSATIIRRSLDARRGRPPQLVVQMAIGAGSLSDDAIIERYGKHGASTAVVYDEPDRISMPHVDSSPEPRPIVVGAGPAGIFCAYRLVRAGVRPIVIDRGMAVKERTKSWFQFLKGAPFDPESNLLYGEGGAGTYSDGKLYTRVRDARQTEILEALVGAGAPDEILTDARPHIGSNKLPSIVRRFREQLIEMGVEFRFSTRLEDIQIENGHVRGVTLEPGGEIRTDALFLGIGHSARDTLEQVVRRGVRVEPKPFQIGARVEHPQSAIDRMQYGDSAGHPSLPPADYRIVEKGPYGDVFSFCMCPGGEILPATEKPGVICVNGASKYQRIGEFANSGFVLTVHPDRFPDPTDPMSGIRFQEEIESKGAALAEHPFGAPANRLVDFIEGRESATLPPSSYPLPLTAAPFDAFLPPSLMDGLRAGLASLCRRVPEFDHPEAIIVGPESRSSSPVRIVRDDDTFESPTAAGLYPMGEGAGFAGGIVSAAIDGMRCGEKYIERVSGRGITR